MKIILNSLLIAFLAYFFIPLFNSGIASEKDIIIQKKDIIIRSEELKAEPKKDKDAEEFKPIEKPAEKKQETPSLDIVDKYLKEVKKYEARNALSDIFINKTIPEKQKEIKELLDKLNEELIFSPLPSPDATMYTVQAGDIMAQIAKQFNTNYELIKRINNKSPTRLNIGDKLFGNSRHDITGLNGIHG